MPIMNNNNINNFTNSMQPMALQNDAFYRGANSPVGAAGPSPENIRGNFQKYTSFDTAFNPLPNIPFNGVKPQDNFKNYDFRNRDDLLHNNMYPNVKDEEIREYSLLIDSKDRNYKAYPNPFEYKVKLGPLNKSTTIINGRRKIFEEPNPVINSTFQKIRYVYVKNILLPNFYQVDCHGIVDKEDKLTDNMYVLLNIKELDTVNTNNATNDLLEKAFDLIYFDYFINPTHYHGVSRNTFKLFNPDDLGVLNNLTISITDPYGNVFDPRNLNCDVGTEYACNCRRDCDCIGEEDDREEIDKRTLPCIKHNPLHPLNPLYQNHIELGVGVVEAHLNKKVYS
jgi:hypothetical protein